MTRHAPLFNYRLNMEEKLRKKVDRAIKLIRSAGKAAKDHGQRLEVAYSGGKDSDVILELTKMSGVEYEAIYKNTTIDPKGTIKHAKDVGATIIRPEYTFFEIIERHGLPNIFKRFCCGYLKEYKVRDYAVLGIRREESSKRTAMYKEPEACRVYKKNEVCHQYFPILDWTLEDVRAFIEEREIRCAPVYYDDKDIFHVERRLGCLCCPLIGKKRVEQFKQHPNMVKAYCRHLKKFRDTHKTAKTVAFYNDEYEHFVRSLFYWRLSNEEWHKMQESSFLPPPNYKEFLENYFNIKFNDK